MIKKVIILSDSLSCILALKQLNNFHPLVFEIKNLVKQLENSIKIDFIWIKSHSDIAGNERADYLDKEASKLHLS